MISHFNIFNTIPTFVLLFYIIFTQSHKFTTQTLSQEGTPSSPTISNPLSHSTEQNPPLPSTPILSPPPTENALPTQPRIPQWQNEWQQAQAEVERNRILLQTNSGPKVEILRVNQLDAIKLDQEINEVLKMQFMKIFAFMRV
jgi:hypothetical protein